MIKCSSNSYILNTASGEKCIIDKVTYDNILNYKKIEDPALVSSLVEKKIIFTSKEDKNKYTESLIIRSNKESVNRPILYGVCLSYSCNLKCTYCYENSLTKRSRIIEEKELDQAFTSIFSIHEKFHPESKKVIIVLFGGEPFTKGNKQILNYFFNSISDVIAKFKSINIECRLTVFTNGLNFLDYSELILSKIDIIDSVMLTLNGPKDYHDKLRPSGNCLSSFEKTVESIDFSLTHRIPVNVRMDVNKQSLAYLDEMSEFVINKKWNRDRLFRYYVSPIKWTNIGDDLNEVDILKFFISKRDEATSTLHKVFSLGALRITHNIINLLNRQEHYYPNVYHCEAVRGQQYVFGSDGHIYRCLVSVGKCNKSFGVFLPKLKMNNQTNNDWTNRNISNLPKCINCEYAFICAGGCAYISKEKKGNIYIYQFVHL